VVAAWRDLRLLCAKSIVVVDTCGAERSKKRRRGYHRTIIIDTESFLRFDTAGFQPFGHALWRMNGAQHPLPTSPPYETGPRRAPGTRSLIPPLDSRCFSFFRSDGGKEILLLADVYYSFYVLNRKVTGMCPDDEESLRLRDYYMFRTSTANIKIEGI
jgi:hypothetical protein